MAIGLASKATRNCETSKASPGGFDKPAAPRNRRTVPNGLRRGGRRELSELRFADVTTFLSVQRQQSITGAARELEVTASQVSKAVARLERQLGVALFRRSVRGVMLTDEARRLLPDLEEVATRLQRMARARSDELTRRLTIAGASYSLALFLPSIAEALPAVCLRALELPPPVMRAALAENEFDALLAPGRLPLPSTWQSTPIGEMRRGLFARPSLARRLGSQPVPVSRLVDTPFITPVVDFHGRVVPVDDECPLRPAERRRGHEAQSILMAVELAARTEHLVFGPAIAARRHLDAGTLVEITVERWRSVETLHFAYNTQQLRTGERRTIVATAARTLAQLSG
jgi:DNA-binding transcriptional LysR family regulator